MLKKLKKHLRGGVFDYVAVALIGAIYAFMFEIFVFPNNFAPSGLNGLATMVQYVFGFEVGYLSLIINFPLIVASFFVLNRKFAVQTTLYSIVFSATLIVMDHIDISSIVYAAEDTGGMLLAAIVSGVFNGALYSWTVRAGGCTGGNDVIGALINHKYPEYDTVWIIFVLNVIVVVISFFVYGMDYQPVFLCTVFIFVSSKVSDGIFKGARAAAKFEVITTHPDELAEELMKSLRHGCTVVSAKGMYTKKDKAILICVVNTRQVVEFEKIIGRYSDTFAYISTVNGTLGEFQKIK